MTTTAIRYPDHVVLSLDVEFLSDWHIGSGLEVPGSVDRRVRRSRDDLPLVPGKTLTGMVRDSAEILALALAREAVAGGAAAEEPPKEEMLKQSRWYQWVLWLFGDQPNRQGDQRVRLRPHAARVSIRPAHLPESLREALKDNLALSRRERRRRQILRDAVVFTKAGVKLDCFGRPIKRHLHFDEMVRGGITLTSSSGIELSLAGLSSEQKQTALNLVALAVDFVERLGGKRRRGAGRAKLALRGPGIPSDADLAAWLERTPEPPDVPVDAPAPASEGTPQVTTPDRSGWRSLKFELELAEPLLVTERTVGNVVKSLDFVPGTLLLPIVARAFEEAGVANVQTAILSDNLRVGPAVAVQDGVRGLPTPACLFHRKGDERFHHGNIRNRFVEPDPDQIYVKDFRGGYVIPSGPQILPIAAKIEQVVLPHNTIGEKDQRPTPEVGGVFAYQAIAAGTVLQGEIRLRATYDDLTRPSGWWKKLPEKIRLGRSKKDDYGAAWLRPLGELQDVRIDLIKSGAADDSITVWLTSDTLLRDAHLRSLPTADELKRHLTAALGLATGDVEIQAHDSFIVHRRIESWHRGWGLPRPTLVCLAGGSCLRLRLTGAATAAGKRFEPAALTQLVLEGIGMRRAEGFGMLCVNHSLVTAKLGDWQTPKKDGNRESEDKPQLIEILRDTTLPTDPVFNLAEQIEEGCWRRLIRQKAFEETARSEERRDKLGLDSRIGKPNPSQAALIRNLMQLGFNTAEQRTKVAARLDHIHRLRELKWPANSIGKFQKLFEDDKLIWNWLKADGPDAPAEWPCLTKGGRNRLQTSLREEAIRTFVNAALKAHVRELESAREPSHRNQTAQSNAG